MPDDLWTSLLALVSAVVGGVLTTAGAIFAERRKAERDRRHALRDRLHDDCAVLIDDLRRVVATQRATIHAIVVSDLAVDAHRLAYEDAVAQVWLQSVKIGDQPLDQAIEAWIDHIETDVYRESEEGSIVLRDEEDRHLSAVLRRLNTLLHTDAEVDPIKDWRLPDDA